MVKINHKQGRAGVAREVEEGGEGAKNGHGDAKNKIIGSVDPIGTEQVWAIKAVYN